jgi:glycine hydroxymethyltransferase
LKGSALGNDFIGHNSLEHYSRIEQLAVKRACKLFNAEHAILRLGNPVAASRVVLLALAQTGDTILSFNLRKKEHCTGEQMKYNFIKFAIDPHDMRLNYENVKYLALKNRPKLIIFSPTNYPHNIDYLKMQKMAEESGAILWVDLGQNAGLVAAGKIPSPVPYADILTFAGSDGLHGPQSGIILCRKKFADLLEKAVIETGHASLKKNVMAALAITFNEVSCPEFKEYAQAVMDNARALENGLNSAGIETYWKKTENHLVLPKMPENVDNKSVAAKLEQAGLLVKAETLMTSDENISYPILRLSSLDPTTRALNEEDLFRVGATLGEFLKSPQDSRAIKKVEQVVKEIIEGLPLFSEDWLPAEEIIRERDAELIMKSMIYGM